METAYINRGGWFRDNHHSTGTSSGLIKLPMYVLVTGLIVGTGTGAFADDLNCLQQHRLNGSISSHQMQSYAVKEVSERNSVEDIKTIRNVFSPAVSDIAKCFSVSRQTIYNWLKGEQTTPEHADRLRDLAIAADMFTESGQSVNGALLKRKFLNGKNMFEVIRDGGSAKDAAQLLLQIVRREANQRDLLAARLAGRKISQNSADSDLMPANDEV